MKNKPLFNKSIKIGALAATISAIGKLSGKSLAQSMSLGLITALGASVFISAPAHALSESSVQSYASAMTQAANSQNIGQISQLIADEAIISVTRAGKTANLDKHGYLQLLQKNWAKSKNYRYDIRISDVLVTGNQARAQFIATETWTEDGKSVKIVTTSRATLSQSGANAVLLRSVSQVSID